MENLKIKGRIWIETGSGLKIGIGRARLLEHIHQLGSIAEAAKALKIPYRKAWGIVRDINSNASCEIVTKEVGGKSGGQSQLTDYGKLIVEKFKTAEESFLKFSKETI
ncbi:MULTISPECIES: winged helix-turn-helix domain-containing protein [unclassified Chryseobacterium]|jgi:molybdate transport repressor ModE-like protein|uniref:winged helix-turn-helix domain-containing protein n=1 Tax=unclassified Chryseobacterium TaxID=2593645 RepID=UPI001CBBFC86|nr:MULTISPECIES: LysR family transcriptional regulator [unclassified Chryseobacterium]MDR3025067.1 LysR family transcriptional regulator [Chryseobacterium sp.]